MKNRLLWRVSVVTSPEAEDIATHALGDLVGAGAVSYTDLDTGETHVAAYLERKPAWHHLKPQLEQILATAREHGLNTGSGQLSLDRIRREDWAQSWKRHFKPLEPHPALLVRPSWSKKKPRKDQSFVVLDPGLSFGTGHHPTTSFCLHQIAGARVRSSNQSLLDIGTGSGILAISGAKLGYSPIAAFDFDPDAVKIARSNARVNRVDRIVRPRVQDVTRLPLQGRQYSVVCANLIANLLIAERRRICSRVAPGGLLVLAGILEIEFAKVCGYYASCGFVLHANRIEGEWQSGSFIRITGH